MSKETRHPWSQAEARAFVHQALPLRDENGWSWDELDDWMARKGWTARGGDARRCAVNRNRLVRAELFGDHVYEERRHEVLKKDLEAGKMGPVSIVQTNRPRTVEEMADMFGIDEELYFPHKIRTNQWANNWQTRVEWWLDEGKAVEQFGLSKDFLDMLAEAGNEVIQEGRRYSGDIVGGNEYLDVIEIVDAHHGALSWAKETGTNWDLDISIQEHKRAMQHFLDRRTPGSAKCILRLGDDMCHFDTLIDGKAGATQRGTIQDIDSRWQKMFLEVSELGIHLILMALAYYDEVDIILIQGNHDWQTSFYLGQVWRAFFQNNDRVRFDCEPRKRKYYRWGTTLLGFTHKFGKLGLASLADKIREEARKDWGETDYVEFHMADEHHEEVVDKTGTGVVIRKLRGLVPNDSWHDDEGYSSHRGAQMFTFHLTEGLERVTYYRTRKQAPYRGDKDVGPHLR